jgi:hypothetical protein
VLTKHFLPYVMASSSATSTNLLLGHAISEKLAKNSYLLWKAQVLPIVCGAWLEGFLTGASKAPEGFIGDKEEKTIHLTHELWVALDQ